MGADVIPINTAEALLREFTDRCWEYDAMAPRSQSKGTP